MGYFTFTCFFSNILNKVNIHVIYDIGETKDGKGSFFITWDLVISLPWNFIQICVQKLITYVILTIFHFMNNLS